MIICEHYNAEFLLDTTCLHRVKEAIRIKKANGRITFPTLSDYGDKCITKCKRGKNISKKMRYNDVKKTYRCCICREEKPASEFYDSMLKGRSGKICRPCAVEKGRKSSFNRQSSNIKIMEFMRG